MTTTCIRQTRIYAPITQPYDDPHWAETMMARLVKPLVLENPKIKWFWMTRYRSLDEDFADSEKSAAPSDFFQDNDYRSLRFRIEVEEDDRLAFEEKATDLITQENCWIADWRDYDIRELCSDRFIGENRAEDRRHERLSLVKEYLGSVARLAIHALLPKDDAGRFRFETNDNHLNPHGSAFFSLHHLFCNTTEVLLTALVTSRDDCLQIGTLMYPPPLVQENQLRPWKEQQIRF